MRASKVVILAAGRGTRMRRAKPGAVLDEPQREMAARGLKGLIPFHGRPYLSYVISALADAGIREVCLVVAPGENAIRRHFEALETERVRIHFAVQHEPRGSAHALLAAEPFTAGDPFLVINADNYYPAAVIQQMREMDGSGLAGFEATTLTSDGNIPADRVAAYALVTTDGDGCLDIIIEKPGADEARRLAGRSYVSMNCWRFGPSIFDACRSIPPSARGEYEIPDAVSHAIRAYGEKFFVLPVDEPVLDLSCREDVPTVSDWLRDVKVTL